MHSAQGSAVLENGWSRWVKYPNLAGHDWLTYRNGAKVFDEWGFTKDGSNTSIQVSNKIRINDGMALVAGAVAGGRKPCDKIPP